MAALFGHCYDDDVELRFSHDQWMMSQLGAGVDLQPWRPYRGKRKRSLSRDGTGSERSLERVDEREQQEEEEGEGDGVSLNSPPFESAVEEVQPPPPQLQRGMSSSVELTDGEVSFAWRKEVQASALGVGGRGWRDVELVSVSGHQAREVEM